MAKKSKSVSQRQQGGQTIALLISLAVWLTGIIVSLSVGFGMIDGPLSLPWWLGGRLIAQTAGWIVVVLTLLSVLLVIVERFR
ncbi:hypothetical protein J4456_05350 [Candidatus Pacearchaeota archaeon]|nr:hypothetical protein [Candidatus Pacearchaeota archaeon]